MSGIVQVLLGNTSVAIVLAMLALVALRWRKPALSHALWLLVLIKLVTPGIVEAPVPAPDLSAWVGEHAETGSDVVMEADEGLGEEAGTRGSAPTTVVAATKGGSWGVREGLMGVWAAGTVVVLGRASVRVVRFRRLLREGSDAAGEAVQDEAAELAGRLGLDWCPEVRVVREGAAVGPMVYFDGGRPVLVVPGGLVGRLSPGRRAAVLSHELAHLRRGDHWVRMLELLVTAALWWHPLVWVARRGLHEAEEQCCDAWVVWALPGGEGRREYASALVDAVEYYSAAAGRPALPPVASGLGQLKYLRRRIAMIVTHGPSRTLSLAAKGLVLLAALALPVVPGCARGPQAGGEAEAPPAAAAREGKDQEVTELKERVRELEERLARAERMMAQAGAGQQKQVADPLAAPRPQVEAQIAKARARMRADAKQHGPDAMQDAEQLYQVANRNWRSPAAKESLEKMLAKYPDVNRTGCALLYLGQMSLGEEKVKYMTQAYEKHGDCYYGNGAQVGPLGRFMLGAYYHADGRPELAKPLFDEVLKSYPEAIDHSGRSLAKVIERIRSEGQGQQPQ